MVELARDAKKDAGRGVKMQSPPLRDQSQFSPSDKGKQYSHGSRTLEENDQEYLEETQTG